MGTSQKCVLPWYENELTLSNTFNSFFMDKILKIRDDIFQSPTPVAMKIVQEKLLNKDASQLTHFEMATEEEICNIVSRASLATCDLDPIPSSFIKDNIDVLAPAIRDIANLSLKSGDCPAPLKKAAVLPLLKKKGLDPETLKNYRPVSNLSFISKIRDHLRDHLSSNELWGKTQSAYQAFHSTETALLRVQNDIFSCMVKKKLMALVMQDLCAAFDTIDHNILLRRLESRFGIKGVALQWIKSYLSQRKQSVKIGNSISDPIELFLEYLKALFLVHCFLACTSILCQI